MLVFGLSAFVLPLAFLNRCTPLVFIPGAKKINFDAGQAF
jgi:hypothetical protein